MITLTTDFGNKDAYVGAFKGALFSLEPSLKIVDISHNIVHYNINNAAVVFKTAFSEFPEGTIHVLRVGEYLAKTSRYLCCKTEKYFLIAPDNGLLSLCLDKVPRNIKAVDYSENKNLDHLVAKLIVQINLDGSIENIGNPVLEIVERIALSPVINPNSITGSVVHVDHYKNLITNISEETFLEERNQREFEIVFKGERLTRIREKYNDVNEGTLVCFFNEKGLLQIAVNQGKAEDLFGLHVNETVQIRFF